MFEIVLNYIITGFILIVIILIVLALVFLIFGTANCLFFDNKYDSQYPEWADDLMFFSLLTLFLSKYDDD